MTKTEKEVMKILGKRWKIPKKDWDLVLRCSIKGLEDIKTIIKCQKIYDTNTKAIRN